MVLAIEAMIFDFGNVLIGWNPENLYRKLIADPAERRQFLAEVVGPDWNHQQDLGRPFAAAVAERAVRHPERAALIRAYHERFLEMLSGPIAEGNDLLDRLVAKDFPCYGLTNWSAETFEVSRPLMPFLSRMKYTAMSGALKMAKPDPAIFHHLLGVIGRPAEACAFLDDSPTNIAAAKALGIKAVLFKNDGSAAAELRELGVPV
jgi:2-haloacid dehalogenase